LVHVIIGDVWRRAIRAAHRRDHEGQSEYGPPCCKPSCMSLHSAAWSSHARRRWPPQSAPPPPPAWLSPRRGGRAGRCGRPPPAAAGLAGAPIGSDTCSHEAW